MACTDSWGLNVFKVEYVSSESGKQNVIIFFPLIHFEGQESALQKYLKQSPLKCQRLCKLKLVIKKKKINIAAQVQDCNLFRSPVHSAPVLSSLPESPLSCCSDQGSFSPPAYCQRINLIFLLSWNTICEVSSLIRSLPLQSGRAMKNTPELMNIEWGL